MKPLLLVGGGGHCRSCIDVVETSDTFTVAGFIAASNREQSEIFGYPFLGKDDDLPEVLDKVKSALVAVGQIHSPDSRIRLFEMLKKYGAHTPTVISKFAYTSMRSEIGEGTIVMHGAIVNIGASIGENCIINSGALVEHNAQVEAHCHLSTNSCLNGDVHIGEGCFIGSGVVVREGVKIGRRSVIGAGCVVLKDVVSGTVLRG